MSNSRSHTHSHSAFTGTGVAIVTPFHKDGSVDYKSLSKVIEHIIKGGVEYVVVLGTTGESATLSKSEKSDVLKYVVEKVNKRIPVVVGIGGNNTSEVAAAFNSFNLKGVSAILSVSPYYNKPNQRGLLAHYDVLAKEAPLPIILYNVPGRTAMGMTADTQLQLAHDHKNIIGTKEASGNLELIMQIIKYKPKDFLVISGDDVLTLPIIACGGDGVISVVANAFPKDYSEMTRQALKGNYIQAQKLHYKLTDIIPQLFIDGSPGGIKEVLELMGLCRNDVRLPLVTVNKQTAQKLKELWKKYK
jgi:4-hydroxy-tetrahydrodipicolinate synthase